MILIALDVDGTISTSAGPVPWEKVKLLHLFLSLRKAGACGIVSPSPSWPQETVPAYLPENGGSREANLRAFAAAFPDAIIKIYVSDNEDRVSAASAGWAYMTQRDFAVAVGERPSGQ